MKKIFILQDFLCHSQKAKAIVNRSTWIKMSIFAMKQALTDNVSVAVDYGEYLINSKNEIFDRNKFFKLCGKDNIPETYYPYKSTDFTPEAIEYLSSFFDEDTIVIGYELGKQLCDLLSEFGCQIIDMALHSFRIFDDILLLFHTNNIDIHNRIWDYKVPEEKFYMYGLYWKEFMLAQNMVLDDNIQENSVLFVGQTLKDKSVDDNGKYLNITHYKDRLTELSKEYSKIYYSPHPALGSRWKVIYDFIKKEPYIELLGNVSTYSLLASDKIKKVIALSTSVLFEAKYFGKETEYLFKPLYNIDEPFTAYSYISVERAFLNPKFWAHILAPICNVKSNVLDEVLFTSSKNKLRNVGNNYMGYAQLDDIKRIENKKKSYDFRKLFNYYIGRYR